MHFSSSDSAAFPAFLPPLFDGLYVKWACGFSLPFLRLLRKSVPALLGTFFVRRSHHERQERGKPNIFDLSFFCFLLPKANFESKNIVTHASLDGENLLSLGQACLCRSLFLFSGTVIIPVPHETRGDNRP